MLQVHGQCGLAQISPAILVRSCRFCFLLLSSRGPTNPRGNSQGDTDTNGEVVVLQMDYVGINTEKLSGTKLRKRKNKTSVRFCSEMSQVKIIFFFLCEEGKYGKIEAKNTIGKEVVERQK